MIEEKFKLPLMDFIDRASEIPNLMAVILFGSVVRGETSPKSDIDILLIFKTHHNPELGPKMDLARRLATEISLKHHLDHSFSFVLVNEKEIHEMDPDFFWNVINEGMLLWGKPEYMIYREPASSMEPYLLIKYSTQNLEPSEKRKLIRRLYTSKKMLMNKETERIGPGVILAPAERLKNLKELFDSLNVNYSVKKVYSVG